MATCRVAINNALRLLKAVAVGDDPTADELAASLEEVQTLVLAIHEARGPLYEVDVSGAYCPGEDQRVRVQAGATVAITLPNSVSLLWTYDPFDYGFLPGFPGLPPAGSTGAADNIQFRAPRDGSRIEIIGTSPALYFYRADLNQWMAAYGLTIDAELPFNNRLTSAFEAMLAERLIDVVSDIPLTPALQHRIATGRSAMLLQSGRRHTRRVGEYF
jgi:hypothetical protein